MMNSTDHVSTMKLILDEFDECCRHIRTQAQKYNVDLSKITFIKKGDR